MAQTDLFGRVADQESIKKHALRTVKRNAVFDLPKRVRKPFQSIPQTPNYHDIKEAGNTIVQRIRALNHPLISEVVLEDFDSNSGYIHVVIAGHETTAACGMRGTVRTVYALANTLVPEGFNLKSITNPIRSLLTDIKNTKQIFARITDIPNRVYSSEMYGEKDFKGYDNNLISIDYNI